MKNSFPASRFLVRTGIVLIGLIATAFHASTQAQVANDPPVYGPFNGVFLPDGDGLKKPLAKNDSVLRADSPWSIYAWVKPAEALKMPSLVAGLGEPEEEFSRYLALSADNLILWIGKDNSIFAPAALSPGKWHFVAATFDGEEFRLYSDGAQIASGQLESGSVSPTLEMAPPYLPSPNWRHFGGSIASLTVIRSALSSDEIKQLYEKPADFSLIEFEEGSKPWPVQTRGQAGYRAPQDPATMPHTKAAFSHAVAKPLQTHEILQANGDGHWTLAAGWTMIPAPQLDAGRFFNFAGRASMPETGCPRPFPELFSRLWSIAAFIPIPITV